ncbi:MAG: fumarylacetoacetate hydrolase family protein [Candidatus Lokiarchaeota archaeon]|nr:fumarylacetoacetate hydrolase family protein [Candidatus Lokiarchaeota archaeon]MCK4480258.1 fumarylacetoacetate hydrolase family protein [Candidatus Lokiarchaeota archaeon]
MGDKTIYPTKIICLGRNYIDHAKEMKAQVPKNPIFFVKTVNTLVADGDPIIYPKILYNNQDYNQVDHEVELAFIISQNCKNIQAEHGYEYVEGYTIFLDITARKMQISDRNINLPWYRSKNFDSFGPIGPRIVNFNGIEDPHNLNIQLKINGEIRQQSNTKHMIFKIPEILEYLSKFITLSLGDIVATGTPSGVGPIQPEDIIEASIEKIGTITHKVILEE